MSIFCMEWSRTIVEISAMRHLGEEQMHRTAAETRARPETFGTDSLDGNRQH